ncbi:MAG: hypothetical protein KGH69_02130 [Candidatus Micrarchaeota archaeon]|nr:hypothetical protein [Candidatus Micrarchaeota archaeon]
MKPLKLQSSVDFMASYGMGIIIILISIAIIYKIATTSTVLATPYCTPNPGFGCEYDSINTTGGILVVRLSQAIGSQITINGASCSTTQNDTGTGPKYGNIFTTNGASFYPSGKQPGGRVMYSDNFTILYMYCYDASGVAKYPQGTPFSGYVWINYTIQNYVPQTQRVLIVSTVYT